MDGWSSEVGKESICEDGDESLEVRVQELR
jgi:hypothetical protein